MPIVNVPGKPPFMFIHIPKTGGTSVEDYLVSKGVPVQELISQIYSTPTHDAWDPRVSLQHQLYKDIKRYTDIEGIDTSTMAKVTVVRNPYMRLVSDLFFHQLITPTSTPEEVYTVIKTYIDAYLHDSTAHDNHARPQSDFLLDDTGVIEPTIRVFKLWQLKEMMNYLEFTDFDNHSLKNRHNISPMDYMKYLNRDSLDLINSIYATDFELFGYDLV